MKRLFVIITLVLLATATKAQISTNAYYDGYWGEWKDHTIGYYPYSYQEYSLFGNYSGFVVYKNGGHPSEFLFKFSIDGYWVPTKKEIKEHLKSKEFFKYSGWVEYYVTEQYPTIKAVLKTFGFPCFTKESGKSDNPCVKRLAKAEIHIEPYKKLPRNYNIWFDDVAVAIDLQYLTFNNK